MTKRTVRGLLDTVGLTEGDHEYEWISSDYVPGLGLGATPQARRWAYIGYQQEIQRNFKMLEKSAKKKGGRPQTSEALRMPSKRAVHMWLELRNMPISFRLGQTNRELINWILKRTDLPDHLSSLWVNSSGLEKSLSQGRTYWDIQDDWSCETLEEGLLEAQKSEQKQK